MAINRFDTPAKANIQETFVPQVVDTPFNELYTAIQHRQKAYDDTQDLLDESMIKLSVNAIDRDVEERDSYIKGKEKEFYSIVDEAKGDLSRAGNAARKFARGIHADLTRGKLAAIQNRFNQKTALYKKLDDMSSGENKIISKETADYYKTLADKKTANVIGEDGTLNSNYYTDISPSKEINLAAKAEELLKAYKPDTKSWGANNLSEGVRQTFTREVASGATIQEAAMFALQSDPEAMDYVKQELQKKAFYALESIPPEKRTPEALQQIAQSVQKYGKDLIKNAAGFAGETLGYTKTTMTEKFFPEYIANGGKMSELNIPTVAPISVATNAGLYNSPEKLTDAIQTLSKATLTAQEDLDRFIKDHNIDPNTNISSDDNTDYYSDLLLLKQKVELAKQQEEDVKAFDNEMKQKAGFNQGEFNELLEQERLNALRYYEANKKNMDEAIASASLLHKTLGNNKSERQLRNEILETTARKEAERNNPKFKIYKKLLQEASEKQTQNIGVLVISEAKTQKEFQQYVDIQLDGAYEDIAQNVSYIGTQDVDKEDLETNLKNAKTKEVTGVAFNPINSRVEFTVSLKDEDGKGLGRVGIKAPASAIAYLHKKGNITYADNIANDILSTAENRLTKSVKVPELGLTVEIQDQTDASITNPNASFAPYVISIPYMGADGKVKTKIIRATTRAEAVDKIKLNALLRDSNN